MFTGIIEALGKIESVIHDQTNIHFILTSPFTAELKIDQSLCHNGVCLTVVEINGDTYKVTAIEETLKKTNLGSWKAGDIVNLERSMSMNGRFDGHMVQGHVDQVAVCKKIEDKDGSTIFTFEYDPRQGNYTVEKGSVCVNGISLTVLNSEKNSFSVAIIPYTYNHTNLKHVKAGNNVNIEFDVFGKYIKKMFELYK